MRRLIGWTLVLVGAAWAGWSYWQEAKRPAAQAWAAGTDRIS